MSSDEARNAEEKKKKTTQLVTANSQVETINQPIAEVDKLKLPLERIYRISSPLKIGTAFMALGVLSLAFSVISNSQVLAFIGLGLTFWGALFFLVRPLTYVKGSLLDATAISSYATVDRIIRDLKYKGKGLYIPPYPKEVYLPEHLKGLKEMIVYIPAENSDTMPSIEEIAGSRFIIENPEGITIAPPGLGLLNQFEKESKMDPTKMDLESLCETLPLLILENFQLAKDIEMKVENEQVYLKVSDSIHKNLYREERLKSVYSLGCPLVSAIACAIAKTTGKIVAISSLKVSPETETIEVSYSLVKG